MDIPSGSRPHDLVRARVEDADRQRRGRDSSRRIWRAAPIVAFACLAIALAGRLSGWSPLVSITAIVLAGAGLAAAIVLSRRPRTVTDADAAAIDAHAEMNGELRSAHWFAHHTEGADADGWIDFHVGRAADRVQRVDWSRIYPTDPASRAKVATIVFAAAAIALAVVFPGRASIAASNNRTATADTPVPNLADVIRQIEGILTEAELGQGRELTAAEIKQLFAQLDKLRAQQGAKAEKKDGKPGAPSESDLKALAERAKRASENTDNDPRVRDQLAEMAEKLSEPGAQNAENKEPADANQEGPQPSNETAKASSSAGDAPAGAQSVKEASGSAAAGIVMMTSDGGGKEASFAVPGGQGIAAGRGQMPDLAAALRKETVESAQDDEGEKNVTGERRQTERGAATAAYAHTAVAPAGRGRSAAPPVVPESRRPALRSYFIRKQ